MDRNKFQKDAAFKQLLHNVLETTQHNEELVREQVSENEEQLLALQRRFSAQPLRGFKPGQIVQWKPGMRNRRLPKYGEPAIVMEVLNPAVFDNDVNSHGSNLYHEPLTLVLGIIDPDDGEYLCLHYDGRRFEVQTDCGETP